VRRGSGVARRVEHGPAAHDHDCRLAIEVGARELRVEALDQPGVVFALLAARQHERLTPRLEPRGVVRQIARELQRKLRPRDDEPAVEDDEHGVPPGGLPARHGPGERLVLGRERRVDERDGVLELHAEALLVEIRGDECAHFGRSFERSPWNRPRQASSPRTLRSKLTPPAHDP
jgi:hypothetical protein